MARLVTVLIVAGAACLLLAIAIVRSQAAATPAGPTPGAGSGFAPDATATAILDAAGAAVRMDEPERGVAMLNAAVAQHPGDTELRLALAELLVRTNDPAAAADQFAEAIAQGVDDAATLYAAGSVARLAGRDEVGAEWLGRAASADPANPTYAVHHAQARLALGDADAAKAELLRAGALDEGLALAWGTLGEIHLRENKPGLARDMARRARTLEPGVTAWRVIEARALNRLGEPALALEVLAAVGPESRDIEVVRRVREQSNGLLGKPADASP